MALERFRGYVDQATDLGYARFNLTPLTGEVFADRGLFDKLEYLDNHPEVVSYCFFSNFTLADEESIERLFALGKLTDFAVSLYGHDRQSFMAITGAGERVYRRLLDNLLALERRIAARRFAFEIGWRTVQGGLSRRATGKSELARIVKRFRRDHGIRVRVSREYNNWGGLIGAEDLKGLDIHVRSPRTVYKNGACTLIFSRLLITADGRVNACACRDVDGTLCLGELKERPLREILSARNDRYMRLIESQQRGRFGRVCRDCDLYKSIYRHRSKYWARGVRAIRLEEFYRELQKRSGAESSAAVAPADAEARSAGRDETPQ
jgi:radical SAM protein with 4Fe4S-binding SPASM domain